jgi:hypothetical protein
MFMGMEGSNHFPPDSGPVMHTTGPFFIVGKFYRRLVCFCSGRAQYNIRPS